jgi:hypothetical protein
VRIVGQNANSNRTGNGTTFEHDGQSKNSGDAQIADGQ